MPRPQFTPITSWEVLSGQLVEEEEPRPGSQMGTPDMSVKTENGLLPHCGPLTGGPKRQWGGAIFPVGGVSSSRPGHQRGVEGDVAWGKDTHRLLGSGTCLT